MTGRETRIPKGSVLHRRGGIYRVFSHIAHKRRNVRFKGLRRVHTPPQPLTAHTAAHRAKQGRFGWGRCHYPRSVLRGSGTLRSRVSERHTLPLLGLGRVYARRTQKACGTAMRLCASLSRGVAAPLGCVIFSVSVEIAACMPCAQGLSVCARRGVVSLPSACSTCSRNAGWPLAKTANLPYKCDRGK